MSTPHDEPLPLDALAAAGTAPPAGPLRAAGPQGSTAPRGVDPDDPPWGVASAAFVWLSSIVLMVLVPLLALVPYAYFRHAGTDFRRINETLLSDPGVLIVTLVATLPAHALTLLLVWAVVTGFGKRPFWEAVGWNFGPKFGLLSSVLAAFALLGAGAAVAYLLGVERTPFDEMLESSAAARFAAAFLATATAPLVEELIYRGVLYPALRRALGAAAAVFLVAGLFALVHVSQYKNSPGTIGAIVLLSFSLTIIRASTRRLLPCFVIHLVFNGVQVAGLVYTYFYPAPPAAGAAAAAIFPALAGLPGAFFS